MKVSSLMKRLKIAKLSFAGAIVVGVVVSLMLVVGKIPSPKSEKV